MHTFIDSCGGKPEIEASILVQTLRLGTYLYDFCFVL